MKPFLKWAGNKYQIINHILKVLPPGQRLIEPFAGSCAVFLNSQYSSNLLCDTNKDLINTYQHLQREGKNFIEYCQSYFIPQNNSETVFYLLRDQFNSTNNLRLKCALFLYLNKHCYNGLCRYNTKGEFNTPFGKYIKPYFPAKEMIYFFEKSQTATFATSDFVTTLNNARKGDVVYCDPPYVPLSHTANFTNYSKDGFNDDQQIQLAKKAEDLANQDITVIVSNHYTEFTKDIYHKAALVIPLDVQRYISCSGAKRKKVKEILAIFNPL